MPVPILLVTGFLGAGKTTAVNRMLTDAGGRRIAAVVNDFGAVNIDAALIAGTADGVVSLANGCICCSLEGDLLRTLASLLRRSPAPDAIVVECSGIAEPGELVRTLMDPVIWREAPLETVLCLVDAEAPFGDALVQAQIRAADVVALSKGDLVDAAARSAALAAMAAINPGAIRVEAPYGQVPMALLFPEVPTALPREPARRRPAADRFESFSWVSDRALSLPLLQAAIGQLAPRPARAKGLLETAEQPGRQFVLQFAGRRASLAAAGPACTPATRMVFIAEIGVLSAAEIGLAMEGCVAGA